MSEQLRIAYETLGCRSNYADTVDLQAALKESGAVTCDESPDVIVVNTCTVTDEADREGLRAIRKARERNPLARIVVTGCMAEVGREKIEAQGIADAIIGPGRKSELVQAVLGEEVEALPAPTKKEKRARRSISLDTPLSSEIQGPSSNESRARFHLRVQEGCDNFCTFCIIPQARGALSSRSTEDILADIRRLSTLGYDEVVLSGTHLGGWGEDIGLQLQHLIEAITVERPIKRVRLSSIDPNDVSPELLQAVAKSDIFCSHLHICVQAFTDSTLRRMARRYTLQEACDVIRLAASSVPGVCIGSDVIAGFPGETREELEQATELFLELPISYLHVFPYSEREGTAAVQLDGSVPVVERKRRAARWRALSERRYRDFASRFVGENLEVIVETKDDDFYYGTSREFLDVKIPRREELSRGRAVSVRAHLYDNRDGKMLCE